MPERKRPTKAAAIQYDPQRDVAPVLSAFGEGHMADRIIEKAIEAGVPIQKDPNLAGMLRKLSVGDEIPPELYEVVARVLVFVSQVDRDYGRRIKGAAGAQGE